jgi:mRNA interferase MazF
VQRGEIWLINLDPTIGAEIKKTRPAVIVNDDAIGILPLKVIVPITEWKERYGVAPWIVRLEPDTQNGLDKLSGADAFQVRSVAEQRFVKRLGTVSDALMNSIAKGSRYRTQPGTLDTPWLLFSFGTEEILHYFIRLLCQVAIPAGRSSVFFPLPSQTTTTTTTRKST